MQVLSRVCSVCAFGFLCLAFSFVKRSTAIKQHEDDCLFLTFERMQFALFMSYADNIVSLMKLLFRPTIHV